MQREKKYTYIFVIARTIIKTRNHESHEQPEYMKIALIGYGKMGHAIEELAGTRGHEVVCTIDNAEELAAKAQQLNEADVAIEFTMPSVAAGNIRYCIENDIAIVCGTTGWYDNYYELATLCHKRNGAMLTATNFSIGMNIMFALNERLAQLMSLRDEYSVDITETHHIHKLDAPSGTAITLKEQIMANRETGNGEQRAEIPITSIREGEVPGTHTVRYQSEIDTITITHEAHSRKGLALGALLAAEFLNGKKGVYTMKDVVND